MNAKAILDSGGRVVIPKPLRDALRLRPGDVLSLESDGERMTLRPVRSQSAMQKERGVWVFRSGQPISAAETDDALRAIRDSRGLSERGSKA